MARRPNQIPHSRRSVLPRPRLMTLFSEVTDFPLTVVKASAGYGKTTALTHFVQQSHIPVYWLTITEHERDPSAFVEHLLQTLLPADSGPHVRALEAAHHPLTWMDSADILVDLVNSYIHDECIVVFDDFHVLDNDSTHLQWMDRWLEGLPWHVHVVLATRTEPVLTYVNALHLRNDVLFIRERELAFTTDEVRFLFRPGTGEETTPLATPQIEWLLEQTRGMAMVLSMAWREWRTSGSVAGVQSVLDRGNMIKSQIGPLFLSGLDETHRTFLLQTSVLNSLTADVCNAVTERQDSAQFLRTCERKGYIIADPDGDTYSLHPLVREHLVGELPKDELQRLVRRAVAWYLERGQVSRAVGYLFQLEMDEVEQGLLEHIPHFLARGQVSTVRGWLDRLASEATQKSPGLLIARGDVARHSNQFSEALAYYELAREAAVSMGNDEMAAHALLGSARLYLDTIQPSLAVDCIEQARRYVHRTDTETRLAMLQVEFENAINIGKLRRASRLLKLLSAMEGTHLPANNSDARVLLRSGRLQEAIRLLKSRVANQENYERTALSHREANLLLSLLYSMTGHALLAEEQALLGHSVGDSLQAPFTSAVGYIRLGHALHLDNPLGDACLEAYQMAVQRMDEMDLPRGKSEALLGLCLAYGYRGQYVIARNCAEQGVQIAETVGDVWMAHLNHLALAQVACVNGQYDEAHIHIERCIRAFQQVSDQFLYTTSVLWKALAHFAQHQPEEALAAIDTALHLVSQYDYEDVLLKPTLFGPKDIQQVVPVLQLYRAARGEAAESVSPGADQDDTWAIRSADLTRSLISRLGCEHVDVHPGYSIRVQTFGGFRVWRGFHEISRKDWQREKARQLFQFLITNRGLPLHRDEITEQLWGDAPVDAAERDFKVALNVLSAALEPHKQTRGPAVFIERLGSTYALTAGPLVIVDRDLFEATIEEADKATGQHRREILRKALSMYTGDYLPEMKYESWSEMERDRLHVLYVKTALAYSALCLEERLYSEVIRTCDTLLRMDPVQEEAYVHLMSAYAGLHNRPMVMQTFRNCERALEREFGVSTMPATRKLYEQLVEGS